MAINKVKFMISNMKNKNKKIVEVMTHNEKNYTGSIKCRQVIE